MELETHLVASQTYDATRWTSREHLNLHLKSDSHLVRIDGPVIDVESPGAHYSAVVDVLHSIKDFHLRAKQECTDGGRVRI